VATKSSHRQKVAGPDGVYEIDVLARFSALGVDFTVLVECKHQRYTVKREVVQILNDRLRSLGAQKGVFVSTAQYQRGAIEYAQQHGIALIQLVEGRTTYFTKAYGAPRAPTQWANVPSYAGWMVRLNEEGAETHSRVGIDDPEPLRQFLAT
jgi:restriction system protein